MAFLVSLGGMASASIVKYGWPTVIFGIMLTVVTIVYIAFGISLATLSSSSEADMLEFCETKTRTSASNSKFRGYVYDIDMDILNINAILTEEKRKKKNISIRILTTQS